MKMLTVRLPKDLLAEIKQESRSRHVSKSDVVRERLHQPSGTTPTSGSVSELIGGILEEAWRARVPAGPPQFRAARKQKLAEIIRAKKLPR